MPCYVSWNTWLTPSPSPDPTGNSVCVHTWHTFFHTWLSILLRAKEEAHRNVLTHFSSEFAKWEFKRAQPFQNCSATEMFMPWTWNLCASVTNTYSQRSAVAHPAPQLSVPSNMGGKGLSQLPASYSNGTCMQIYIIYYTFSKSGWKYRN